MTVPMMPGLMRGVGSPNRRIDAACDAFEEAWRTGRSPRIEDCLAHADEADRAALLGELLGLELELRCNRGDRPDSSEYLARFPADAGLVEAAFAGASWHSGENATGPREGDRSAEGSDSEAPGSSLADACESLFQDMVAQSSSQSEVERRGDIGEPEDLCIPNGRCPVPPGEPRAARPGERRTPTRRDSSARLQVLGEVARGGMGAILRGHDTRLGRDLAIKVLLDAHEGNPTIARRFIVEAQITGQLQHPGIVPIYELGILSDRRPYFAMKLVEGGTLAALLKGRTDPAQDQVRFLAIFQQVAQTVAYAHSRGVVHRDLKPSNIMVGSFGEVLVMDWGLARALREPELSPDATARDNPDRQRGVVTTVRNLAGDDWTVAGSIIGTPAYMPPEQARGEVERLDERCDVFALGSILCEILTGRPAYTGRSSREIMLRAREADHSEARARLDGCGADGDLVSLVHDCLAVDLGERARDAAAVAARLAAYTESLQERIRRAELGRAAEQARAEEARRTAAEAQAKALAERRARRLTGALLASVLALTALGVGVYAWSVRQRQERLERVGVLAEKAESQYLHAMSEPAADPLAWQRIDSVLEQAEALLHGTTDPVMSSRLVNLRERAQAERAGPTMRAIGPSA